MLMLVQLMASIAVGRNIGKTNKMISILHEELVLKRILVGQLLGRQAV